MRTLAIDCATEACSVALFDDGRLVAGDLRMLGRGHAEQLVPMIGALPGRGRADRIAVSRGPGSFTGVRVGLAAARALALAWGAELTAYPTQALVAAMARERIGTQPVFVAMTGGHGEWFCEGFNGAGEAVFALASLPPEKAAQAAQAHMVAGSKAQELSELRSRGDALPLWPDARALPLLPESALGPESSPLYGRSPDATPAGRAP